MTTPLDVLIEARQLLLDRGIARGAFLSAAGAFCSIGAVNHVESVFDARMQAMCALQNAISDDAAGIASYRSIANFNDTHTDAEIIEMFDTAIRNLQDAQ